MLSTGNPMETKYKNTLDELNFLMEDMNLPRDLRRRMRGYLRSTKDTSKRKGYRAAIEENFSPELQQEI